MTVGSTTYKYYYAGSDLFRVTDANQNTIWAITWNNSKVVSLTNAVGETFEYVTNYRGDVVRILDANGATVASYDYDPWGNQLSTEPTDSRIKGQPIRYAGYVYDNETKLYYLQARYYDPQTARFISRDPDPGDEDDPITMNGYTYADNNPVMMTDPDGHFAWVAINAGFAVYDGYKAYKSGKSKKAIAVAAAVGLVGGSKIKSAGKILKAVNGNSKKSTRLQHGYEIYNKKTKDIVKVGVSSGKLNKNGSSRRANSQVNRWNKADGYNKYAARVVKKMLLEGKKS